MNLRDLKQSILDGTVGDDLIVFVCPYGRFLADSYIDEICQRKNLGKAYVKTLAETTSSALSLVFDYSADMNVLNVRPITDPKAPGYVAKDKHVAVFRERADDYSEFKNCVVVCDRVDPSLSEALKDYVVEVPRLSDWQVKAYASAKCPGLSEKAIEWLYGACCGDIHKIDQELSKLALMDESAQTDALRAQYVAEGSDLFVKESVFKLVDALIAGDAKTALQFVRHADYYSSPYVSSAGTKERDIDAVGLASLTLAKLRSILLLNYNSGLSADEIGVSKGMAFYLQKANVPLRRLEAMISFLSGIDSKLKANPSALDFVGCRKSALLEYVVLGALTA